MPAADQPLDTLPFRSELNLIDKIGGIAAADEFDPQAGACRVVADVRQPLRAGGWDQHPPVRTIAVEVESILEQVGDTIAMRGGKRSRSGVG